MLREYLARMEETVIGKDRISNRHIQIEQTVIELINKGIPTTVKNIKSETGISSIQQIHSIVSLSVKKGGSLSRVKVNGNTLIIVSEDLLS